MDINTLLNKSIKTLETLPENKVYEVIEFINSISKKHNEKLELQKGIEKIVSHSESFSFLNDEEDIYEENDLIKKYS